MVLPGPVRPLLELVRLLVAPPPQRSTSVADEVDQVGWDQLLAQREVSEVLALRSHLDRAVILGAVRHDLRLPHESETTRPGTLRLMRADDSTVVVGSDSGGTRFRGVLLVRDCRRGSLAEYAVESWHVRDGGIAGLRQLQHVRTTIVRAVRSVDPQVRLTGRTTGCEE